MYKIYHADATKIVHQFHRRHLKVDHIITDPPYDISKKNRFKSMHRNGIDFGKWDKHFDLCGWIPPYLSLLRPGGTVIIFTSYRDFSYIIRTLEAHRCVVKDVIKWVKTNPMPRNINRRYVPDTEFALWAVKKGAKWVFNRPDSVPYQRAEFHTSVPTGRKRIHPTQKSLSLMKAIVSIHTDRGDTVIDPFMGSGTTGIASLSLHRKFIGAEQDSDYFAKTRQRFRDDFERDEDYKKEMMS